MSSTNTSNKNHVNVGVCGAGKIGKVHMSAMNELPYVTIKTLADPLMNESMSEQYRALGVVHTTKDVDEIFKDEDIDAVFICSPTDTHFDYSLNAIATHKHVFCEKPMDMKLSKAKAICDAVKKNTDLVYQVGFNRRFDHNFMAIRQAILDRKIGTPLMIRITSRDPAPPPLDYIKVSGGLFMDMMIHDFDMARYLTGSEITEVYAIGDVLVEDACKEAGDIDSAIVSLKFKNGMIGLIENCRKAVYGYDQRAEVLGDAGAVHIHNDTESTAIISNETGIYAETPLWFFLERYKDAYKREQVAFFHSIQHKERAVVGAVDGYMSVHIAQAAQQSLEQHVPVAVHEIM